MKKFIAVCVFIVFTLVYTSCKKGTNLADPNCAITAANVSGSYKVSDAKYKANAAAAEVDYLDDLFDNKACAKDDIISFGSNSILTIIDAGILCTPPTNESYPWRLDGNKLIIEGDEDAIVTGLDCQAKIIVLKYVDWDVNGDELRVLLRKQ